MRFLPNFIHEIKTKIYDVICVNVFLLKLLRFLRKIGCFFGPCYTTVAREIFRETSAKIDIKKMSMSL